MTQRSSRSTHNSAKPLLDPPAWTARSLLPLFRRQPAGNVSQGSTHPKPGVLTAYSDFFILARVDAVASLRSSTHHASPKMKNFRQTLLLGLILPMVTNAESITAGIKIQEAEAAMKAGGYPEGGLQAVHRDQLNKVLGKSEKAEKDLENFKMWRVDLGTLVVSYVVSTGIVTNLTFNFQDERPRGASKSFELRVISFDTKSAKMVIQTNQQNEAR